MNPTKVPVTIEPYLFFPGTCEEAVHFYQRALDAEVEMLVRYRESPEPIPPDQLKPGQEDKIMHVSFRIGESRLMASDDGCGEEAPVGGFSLSIGLPCEDRARQYFEALSEGGKVGMPLEKTFWSPLFGTVTDRFGVNWMINVHPARENAQ